MKKETEAHSKKEALQAELRAAQQKEKDLKAKLHEIEQLEQTGLDPDSPGMEELLAAFARVKAENDGISESNILKCTNFLLGQPATVGNRRKTSPKKTREEEIAA